MYLLICCIFVITFCFMLIPIHLSLESYAKEFSFAYKEMTRTYNYVSFMSKVRLLESALLSSTLAGAKTKCLVHLIFSSTL